MIQTVVVSAAPNRPVWNDVAQGRAAPPPSRNCRARGDLDIGVLAAAAAAALAAAALVALALLRRAAPPAGRARCSAGAQPAGPSARPTASASSTPRRRPATSRPELDAPTSTASSWTKASAGRPVDATAAPRRETRSSSAIAAAAELAAGDQGEGRRDRRRP